MSIAPVTIFDSYTRTQSSTWGTSDSGYSWENENSYFEVDGTNGRINVPSGAAYRAAYIDLSANGIADQATSEVLMLAKWGGSAAFPTTDWGPILSRTANNTFYYATLQGNYGEIAIGAYINGTRYEINRVSASLVKDQYYWIRFERTGSNLRVKVWKNGVVEPSSWNLTTGLWSESNAPGPGDPGIFYRGTEVAYTPFVSTFYYYTKEDSEPGIPVSDNFERDVSAGFGLADSGHLWEGHVSTDPAIRVQPSEGLVVEPGDGYGEVPTSDTNDHFGIVGPSVTGDIETFARFSINSSQGNTFVYVGLRGDMVVSSGAVTYRGYAVRIASGATSLTLWKKATTGGAWAQLGSAGTAFTALTSNTTYSVRVKMFGTTLKAKIWLSTDPEPPTWSVSATDASPISSGRSFFVVNQTVTTARVVRFYQWEYSVPVPEGATTTHTTAGNISVGTVTDTTAAAVIAFTNDTDADNSITVEYKPTSSPTWLTFGGTKTRSAGQWSWTLTGLIKSTQYQMRVTFSDPDGVVGTNPRQSMFTTTGNGLTTGVVSLVGTPTSTQVDLQATYSGDGDNDSTASVQYRTASALSTLITDTFVGQNGTLLSAHTPDTGLAWVKHPTSNTNASLYISNNRVHSISSMTEANAIYRNTTVMPSAEYTVKGDLIVLARSGSTGLLARMDPTADTYYHARYYSALSAWEMWKSVAGVDTKLGSYDQVIDTGVIYQLEFVVRNDYKALLVNGVELIRSTDNAITGAGSAGIRISGYSHNVANHILLDNYSVQYRTFGGSWTSAGAMTADRPNKKFTKSVTGLTTDTSYEFMVTYADADGITGSNPQSIVTTTIGQAVGLWQMAALTEPTSVSLDVFYLYDNNNNSTLAVQYRSTMDNLWTTVPSDQILVDRVSKKFLVTLVNLRPNLTHQVKAIISDPNGIVAGYSSELNGLITTSGFRQEPDTQDKHYRWKVYDSDDNYITTWHDAGEPEFAWHENGGVSDLTVTLPRKLGSINQRRSEIGHHHRVDIWCIDPSSDGMGPNLVSDPDFQLGGWVFGANATSEDDAGPLGGPGILIVAPTSAQAITRSDPVFLSPRRPDEITNGPINQVDVDALPVPYVCTLVGKAKGGKLNYFAEAYDEKDDKIGQSDGVGETVGPDWQLLKFEYAPPLGTTYIRLCLRNDGKGTMQAAGAAVRSKEHLIYRGHIESYTPKIDQSGEEVSIEVLGPVSFLSDDYIDFAQFVTTQPKRDFDLKRKNYGPADPADMLRRIIDIAQQSNPRFPLYYTADSIKNTGYLAEYTFRDTQLRGCFDKIRSLCPASWHYYIGPTGLVTLRGPEHAKIHTLRLGVEIMNFEVELSVRNLKNYIHVKGRQDEDNSEADGNGSIHYITFDQASIDIHGKRVLFIRDSNILDDKTAEIVGNGRLEEYNKVEQRAQCYVPDEKSIVYTGKALRGYNIEEFRPGDLVVILDPVAGPTKSYWDAMIWDEDAWDATNAFAPLPEPVPIVTVQYHGAHAMLELSERQPSATSDFGRMYRMLQLQDSDKGEER